HDWGISAGYHDVAGRWIDVPAETLAAIRAAMGEGEAPPGTAPPGTGPHDDPVVAFRPGQAPPGVTDGGPFELHTDDGAVAAVDPPRPYDPSTGCCRNPLYLRIEEVPGAGEAGDAESGAGRVDLAALAAEGRALNADRRIDRERVWKLKRTALEHLWVRFSASGGAPAFDAFCAEQGDTLTGFATHCALTERFPGAWVDWPEEYRRPDSPAV